MRPWHVLNGRSICPLWIILSITIALPFRCTLTISLLSEVPFPLSYGLPTSLLTSLVFPHALYYAPVALRMSTNTSRPALGAPHLSTYTPRPSLESFHLSTHAPQNELFASHSQNQTPHSVLDLLHETSKNFSLRTRIRRPVCRITTLQDPCSTHQTSPHTLHASSSSYYTRRPVLVALWSSDHLGLSPHTTARLFYCFRFLNLFTRMTSQNDTL